MPEAVEFPPGSHVTRIKASDEMPVKVTLD